MAFKKAFTASNIKSGWKKTGLHPFQPSVVLDRFNTKLDDRPSLSELSHSILTADDWRKIQRLLKEVVTDTYNKQAQLLTNTVINLTTENKIL